MDKPPFKRNWVLIVGAVSAPVILSFIVIGGLGVGTPIVVLPFFILFALVAAVLFEDPNRGSVLRVLFNSLVFGIISLVIVFLILGVFIGIVVLLIGSAWNFK